MAIRLNPKSINSCATSPNSSLSLFDTERNTVPVVGMVLFPPFIALRYAVPNVGPCPIASPVDFISGPSTVSNPVIFNQEKVGTFTEAPFILINSGSWFNFWPNIALTANLARG